MKHIKELVLNESNSDGKLNFMELLQDENFRQIKAYATGFNQKAFDIFRDQRFLSELGEFKYVTSENTIDVYCTKPTPTNMKILLIIGYALGADSVSEETTEETNRGLHFFIRWWWD